MTYWHGFVGGCVAGAIITLIVTGHIIVMEYSEQARAIALSTLFIVFILTQFLAFYHAKRGKSFFGTTTDGAITGIGFMEAVIVFLLYGFRL